MSCFSGVTGCKDRFVGVLCVLLGSKQATGFVSIFLAQFVESFLLSFHSIAGHGTEIRHRKAKLSRIFF